MNHASDATLHENLLAGLQRLRGRIYLDDGAVERAQLTPDGRHKQTIDDQSWHVLAVDDQGGVCGCARYMPYTRGTDFMELGVSRSALAQSGEWGGKLRTAVETEMRSAWSRGIACVEVGGWALHEDRRCSTGALKIALATYSLARILGGSIGFCTATHRHASSSILKRIGGHPLELDGVPFPSYYDPQYQCQMEILRFDSERPDPKYVHWIEDLRSYLLKAPAISRTASIEQLRLALEGAKTVAPAALKLASAM